MSDTKAIADLLVAARTATVNIKPNALKLRNQKQVYVAESLEKLQDAIASLAASGTALLSVVSQTAGIGAFVDRGDPADADFAVSDFTIDGAWHARDLSGIVPVGTTSVLIRAAVSNSGAVGTLLLRRKGNQNAYNAARLDTPAAGVSESGDLIVACDSNRVIEYNVANAGTYTVLNLTVAGWRT